VERLPKKQHFLFGRRISDLVLDVLDTQIQAQSKRPEDQAVLLQNVQTTLLRIRVLLRLCADRKLISIGQLERVTHRMIQCEGLVEKWIHSILS
jgi:hypothetical protein